MNHAGVSDQEIIAIQNNVCSEWSKDDDDFYPAPFRTFSLDNKRDTSGCGTSKAQNLRPDTVKLEAMPTQPL